jgi:hypothetical protein
MRFGNYILHPCGFLIKTISCDNDMIARINTSSPVIIDKL